MKLIIISGLSGSGKSSVLNVLEDIGYYCIDNLPVSLLATFAGQVANSPEKFYQFAAVGIDARNRADDLKQFPAIVAQLRDAGLECEIFFLDADTPILLKRFSETRRKHPLSNSKISLKEAISLERDTLEPIAQEADLYLDTTHTSLHDLRAMIRNRSESNDQQTMSILFQSFGFKHGVPADADFIFDVRCLPNPYWRLELRKFTGQQKPVIDFLEQHEMVEQMFNEIKDFVENWIPRFEAASRTYLTVSIGCTGGHHRSVYLTERLTKYFSDKWQVMARHRELP